MPIEIRMIDLPEEGEGLSVLITGTEHETECVIGVFGVTPDDPEQKWRSVTLNTDMLVKMMKFLSDNVELP